MTEVPEPAPEPWAQRRYREAQLAWIDAQLRALGLGKRRAERTVRCWEKSWVLRIETDAGPVIFKVTREPAPHDAQVIETLGRRWPGWVPSILATRDGGRAALMRAFDEGTLEQAPPEAAAELIPQALERLACMQRGVAERASLRSELTSLGCRDLKPSALRERIRALHRDVVELSARRELAPAAEWSEGPPSRVARDLDALEELPEALRLSVVHLDAYPYNAANSETGAVLFDWGGAALGPPFLSAVGLVEVGEEAGRARRLEAYLRPWADLLPPRALRQLYRLCRRLEPLVRGVDWNEQRAALPEDAPLRHALEEALLTVFEAPPDDDIHERLR